MKLVTTKYFSVVATALCLANVFLFYGGSKQARSTHLPVEKSSKLRVIDAPRANTSPIALAAHWQPVHNGETPAPVPNSDVAPAAFIGGAAAAPVATIDSEKMSITPTGGTFRQIASGRFLTGATTIALTVAFPPKAMGPGKLTWFRNSSVLSSLAVNTTGTISTATDSIQLLENETNSISASYESNNRLYACLSGTILVTCDTTGPLLQHAELVDVPNTGLTLLANFNDSDLQQPLLGDQFQVFRQNAAGTFDDRIMPQGSPVAEGQTVRLFFSEMPAGMYRLFVKGEPTASNGSAATTTPLRDQVGNFAGGGPQAGKDKYWDFSVQERKFGEHIAFPPFAPPKQKARPPEGFNPGDFVETRVARLYYYRDAHRVAEIINRNIRSYNQAAVTLAERRAEQSRDDADLATDERREKERAAVRSAEQARNAEQKLVAAREMLSEVQGLQSTIRDGESEKAALEQRKTTTTDTSDLAQLNEQIRQLEVQLAQQKANLAKFGGDAAATSLKNSVSAMEQSVSNLRQTELIKQEESEQSDAKEARARAKQFRDEVTAAETDPDTYVAGDVDSEDPVTQVSISVIGEGLIQLRGPIKGINKVRTMINQIDSPVGQIKIGIFTVQVNGEKGDKMEKVVGDAESNIDLSRFLVNHSLELLRKAIQTEAATIANQCEMEGHYQVDRDRRYLYSFFGRDFIDELYAMNSEFLNTENKLLSLHAMDTVSLNRALFILALAKNDVRERIVARFLESGKTELADAEFDFRRSSELKPHATQKHIPRWNRTHLPVTNHYHKEDVIYEAVHRNAMQRYHFRNFSGFFDTGFVNPDTMNPMQREFIRLAQIFKAQLIAEMEWKQRVIERGLIEDRSNNEDAILEAMKPAQQAALRQVGNAYFQLSTAPETIQNINSILSDLKKEMIAMEDAYQNLRPIAVAADASTRNLKIDLENPDLVKKIIDSGESVIAPVRAYLSASLNKSWLSTQDKADLFILQDRVGVLEKALQKLNDPSIVKDLKSLLIAKAKINEIARPIEMVASPIVAKWVQAHIQMETLAYQSFSDAVAIESAKVTIENVMRTFQGKEFQGSELATKILQQLAPILAATKAEDRIKQAEFVLKKTRGDLDHRKMLNHLIDEQEEKFIELVEGTRSHIAVMDGYLKRLSIAIEDDFKVQFYDPAFVRVREAARGQAVNLSQVERTTILTNNRAFAKVDPQATMEFDLPKRQIAIKEAFDAAKALVEDTGALVNDPTFLAAFQMMGGAKQPTTVKNVIPGQSTSTDQQNMGLVPQQEQSGDPGSALQSLVPEPAIYKLETGTGFQIRPVMQPDGDAVVYDFDYMYTTNIREPVRADEKHLGRIKRHFVHTAVQTGNFELREISRYQVALKVSRTSQGVPLLQDIPVVGAAFRPAPSDESSIQQNIILGQTNVYPTLFDLMGLRWAQQVVDLDHTSLLETEHVIRGRQKSIRDYVFGEASKRVDEFLDVQARQPDSYRPDFYHPQNLASPYHPGGYRYPSGVQDPTGNNFERVDRRPQEVQEPPYDRFRHQPVHPERIGPQAVPESIPMQNLRLEPSQLRAPVGRSELGSPRSINNKTPQRSASSVR
jgi:hypothetical protein